MIQEHETKVPISKRCSAQKVVKHQIFCLKLVGKDYTCVFLFMRKDSLRVLHTPHWGWAAFRKQTACSQDWFVWTHSMRIWSTSNSFIWCGILNKHVYSAYWNLGVLWFFFLKVRSCHSLGPDITFPLYALWMNADRTSAQFLQTGEHSKKKKS